MDRTSLDDGAMNAAHQPILLVEDDPNDTLLRRRAHDLGANSFLVEPGSFDARRAMVAALNLCWLTTNLPPRPRVG